MFRSAMLDQASFLTEGQSAVRDGCRPPAFRYRWSFYCIGATGSVEVHLAFFLTILVRSGPGSGPWGAAGRAFLSVCQEYNYELPVLPESSPARPGPSLSEKSTSQKNSRFLRVIFFIPRSLDRSRKKGPITYRPPGSATPPVRGAKGGRRKVRRSASRRCKAERG